MTVKELMLASHETALAKGWWKKDEQGNLEPRSMAEMFCLFHSEVAEALEAFRDPKHSPGEIWFAGDDLKKPEGLVIELVDLVIRIADVCEAMNVGLDIALSNCELSELGRLPHEHETVAEILCDIHEHIVDNGRAWRLIEKLYGWIIPAGKGYRSVENLAHVFHRVATVLMLVGGPNTFEDCIKLKMEYNKSRSFRHGGKRC
jgi:hypothetical protein